MSGSVGNNVGGIKAAKAWVELVVDESKLSRGLARCELEMKAFANKLTNIGSQMFGMGAAMLAPVGYAVRQFAELDDTLRLVRAVTRASAKEFEQLTDKARLLGKTTSFTSQQVAEAMANLGRAGFDPRQIDGMIKHVMNLSRATQTNVATSAEIVGNAMRQFGLQTKDTQRIVDVMTAAANNSSQTLEDIAVSFKYAAPVAKEFGMAIEEVAYYVGVLANQGLKGEMAGTSLRNILARLGGADVQKQFENLGIDLRDRASGRVKSLKTLLKEANDEMNTRGWDALTRQEWLHKTFGLRSMSGGAKLTSSGNQYVKLFEAIMNSAGEAERTAKQMDEGIGGTIRITISALQELGNVIAESVTKELQALGKWIQQTANHLITFFKFNKQLVVQYTKLAGSLALIGAKFFMLGAVLRAFASVWNGVNFTIAATIAINKKLVTAFSSTIVAVRGVTRAFMLSQGASAVFARSAAVVAGTLTAWLPVIGAVTIALGGLFYLFKRNRDLRLETGAQEKADELKRGFSEDERQLRRLAEIQKVQEKTNDDLEEASNIISDLQAKYGDLGLSINRAAREVEGLVDEQKKLNELQSKYDQKAYRVTQDAIDEIEENIGKNEKKAESKFKNLVRNPGVRNVPDLLRAPKKYVAKPMTELFGTPINITDAIGKHTYGLFEQSDWFDVLDREGFLPTSSFKGSKYTKEITNYRKSLFEKMAKNGAKPVVITDDKGNVSMYAMPYTEERKRMADELNDIYLSQREQKQRLFDLRGEQRLRGAGGFVSLDETDLPTISQEYPAMGYRTPFNIKSVEEVLSEIYKNPYTSMNADNFKEFRWNVANALDLALDTKNANSGMLSQVEDRLSNEHPEVYAKGAGFADSDNTRYGLFGGLGYLGGNRVGESRIDNVDDFKQYVSNLRQSLISRADEGGDTEKKVRRIMLERLDEFEKAYLGAILDGTQTTFDFSKWSDLASYEATTLIKDRMKELSDSYKESQKKILNSYVDAVTESGERGFKIYADDGSFVKDETGKDRIFTEDERKSYLNQKANEAGEDLKEIIGLLARIGDLVTAQERLAESTSSEETLRRTQDRTHEDLLEIIRKMDRDYELMKNDIESKHGHGNEYAAKRANLENEKQAYLAGVDKKAEEKIEAGQDREDVERWRKRERAQIEKNYKQYEKALDWQYGVFQGPPENDSPDWYEDLKEESRERYDSRRREAPNAASTREAIDEGADAADEELNKIEDPVLRKRMKRKLEKAKKRADKHYKDLEKAEQLQEEQDAQEAKEAALKEDQEYFSKVADDRTFTFTEEPVVGDWVEGKDNSSGAESPEQKEAREAAEWWKKAAEDETKTAKERERAQKNSEFYSELADVLAPFDEKAAETNAENAEAQARREEIKPLLNMTKGDVRAALKDGLLDKDEFSSGYMQRQGGDYALEDVVTYRGQTYNLAPDGVYRPFAESYNDRANAVNEHKELMNTRARAIEEAVKPEKPSTVTPAPKLDMPNDPDLSDTEKTTVRVNESGETAAEPADKPVEEVFDENKPINDVDKRFRWREKLDRANLPEELDKMARVYFGENIAKRLEAEPTAANLRDYGKLLDDFLRVYREADESDEYGLYAQEYLEGLMAQTAVMSPNEPKTINGKERKIASDPLAGATVAAIQDFRSMVDEYENSIEKLQAKEKSFQEDGEDAYYKIQRNREGKLEAKLLNAPDYEFSEEFYKKYVPSITKEHAEKNPDLEQKGASEVYFVHPETMNSDEKQAYKEALANAIKKAQGIRKEYPFLDQVPESLHEGDEFHVDGTPYRVENTINGLAPVPNPEYQNNPNMIGERGAEAGPKRRIKYWPGATSKQRKELLRKARMEKNDRKYQTQTTGWDEANARIEQEIKQKEYEKDIASRVGNEGMARALDADIKTLERDKVANEYGKAVSNIKRLEKRREIDAHQYREDSKHLRAKQAILERDEQKLERYEKQELREQEGGEYEKARKTREKIEQVRAKIEKSKKDVEGLKDKQARSLEKLWLSNKNYSDAALMINAYESAGIRPLWDINRSFSSRGTFSAEEARGMDTVTMMAEFKQQTELLSSIDENISSMATGEWI